MSKKPYMKVLIPSFGSMFLWPHILEKKVGKGGGRKQRALNPKIRSILILKLIMLVWS